VNPMVGSALQHARRVRKEQTVAVVENHEGGTRGELVTRLRRWRSDTAPGVDFRISYDGGAVFGNPKRGGFGRPI